jgi:hypothetical protein
METLGNPLKLADFILEKILCSWYNIYGKSGVCLTKAEFVCPGNQFVQFLWGFLL